MDAVAVGSPPVIDTTTPKVFHCGRCGISSAEPTCFIIPEKYGKGPRDTRCVACEAEANRKSPLVGFVTTLGTVGVAFFLYTVATRDIGSTTIPALLVSMLLLALVIVTHELGHAITARLCGFEIGAIMIGQGQKLWSFEAFGVPIRIHTWPLFGLVMLGASNLSMPGFRTRLWFTFLMGPMTNALLVAITIAWWPAFVSLLGVQLTAVWLILNALIFLGNMAPHTLNEEGRKMLSDGLALWLVPRFKKEDLAAYLTAAPLVRSTFEFEDEKYEAARATAQRGLERAPGNSHFLVTLSACLCQLSKYDDAVALLQPMLDAPEHSAPPVRATVCNNLAVARLFGADPARRAAAVAAAEPLSATAFTLYPCVLNFRSTRSLLLTASGKPEEALELLAYPHYDRASRGDRSFRCTARAFALQALGRTDESRTEIERAVKFHPRTVELLPRLGLEPVKSVA